MMYRASLLWVGYSEVGAPPFISVKNLLAERHSLVGKGQVTGHGTLGRHGEDLRVPRAMTRVLAPPPSSLGSTPGVQAQQ